MSKQPILNQNQVPSAFPQQFWGSDRHVLIAAAAEQLLNPAAKKSALQLIASLNMANMHSLKDIATWADLIKHQAKSFTDPETLAFLKQHPSSGGWHFVDLPLDVTGYDRVKYKDFTNDFDIIQVLSQSIGALQGKNNFCSKPNALRLVTHLIGDLHQPLHMACGYIKADGGTFTILTDPKTILDEGLTKSSDHGGNQIMLPIKNNLHSYWDDDIATDPSVGDLDAPDDSSLVKTKTAVAPAGDSSGWPAIWASDAIYNAKSAYQSLEITASPKKNQYLVTWEGKDSYDKRCTPIIVKQLKLATQRLALLLNTIL